MQRAVPGIEAAAFVDPAHPVERERRLLEIEALDAEEVRDERGAWAAVEHLEQRADVVTVVRQEQPPHVLGSTSENTLSSHRSRCTGAPVSTMTGSAPRTSIEFTGT